MLEVEEEENILTQLVLLHQLGLEELVAEEMVQKLVLEVVEHQILAVVEVVVGLQLVLALDILEVQVVKALLSFVTLAQ
jgi:hypothetical protein